MFLPQAIEAVYPKATVQTCVVHLIRYSLAHASWKERRSPAAAAEAELESFEAEAWGQKYPAVVRSWRGRWEQIIPFFAFFGTDP